jgi:hypothetical protein
MSKTYTISFNENQIDEINTGLRIMHTRRDNQNKYLLAKHSTDKPKQVKKRKPKFFLSIINDTLQYTETQFIPTKETAFNRQTPQNSSDTEGSEEMPLNTYLIPTIPTIPQLPPFITNYEL